MLQISELFVTDRIIMKNVICHPPKKKGINNEDSMKKNARTLHEENVKKK